MSWYNKKKRLSYRFYIYHLPLLLTSAGIFLGLIDLLLKHYVPVQFEWTIWLIDISIFGIIGYKGSKFIQKLYSKIYIDSLTGLKNKAYFYYRLGLELDKMVKNEWYLSLAMVDIDNFKKINDTYGHIEGDKVLQKVANIIKKNTRSTDAVIRWGGEEFAIILPKTNLKGAHIMLDRIRLIIESEQFVCNDVEYKITVSGGITSTDKPIEQDQLLDMADKALYKAKETKNIVVNIVG